MIDFQLSDEQQMLVDSVRKLMEQHAPAEYLRQLDEEEQYPYELYEQWVKMGLMALPFDEDLGGMGGSVLDMVLVAEQIGRFGYDLAGAYGTPIFTGLNVAKHGTPEQRESLLPRLFSGEIRFSVAITEPGAGSDAGALRTRGARDEDDFVLTGEKVFASGAAVDRTIVSLYCRTDPEAHKTRGLSCLLVDNTTPGVEIHPLHTLGRRMFPTTQIRLNEARVPVDCLLGPLNGGWDVLVSGLGFERIVTSAAYVGNAQTVVDEALRYAKEREQFGRRIGDFQTIAHMLADMQTNVEAARLLAYWAAWAIDNTPDATREVCMAKLFGSESFLEIAGDGMQILGGYGYTMESPMQRHFRAARGSTITAGTSQMQRQTIARSMGLRP